MIANDNTPEGPPDWLVDLVMAVGAEIVRDFSKEISHGSLEHRRWLREATEAFIAGNPVPEVRG